MSAHEPQRTPCLGARAYVLASSLGPRSSVIFGWHEDRFYTRRPMRELADRVAKAVSDVTVGTVIVLVHVALAERERARRQTGRDDGREHRRPGPLAE